MIKYKQLLKSKSTTRKNLWYLCGTDAGAVTDSLDIAKSHVRDDVTSICLGVFFGGHTSIDEIKDFINRPYYEERKLLVIYDTAKVPNLHEIIDLSDKSTFYILVDYGATHPSDELSAKLVRNAKARSVRCSTTTEEELLLLINSRINISDSAARSLAAKSNGDSEWLLNKVGILEFIDVEEITAKLVDLVCTDEGIPSFEDSLIQFDKRRCFLYIKSMGVDNINMHRVIDDAHNLSLLQVAVGQYSRQLRPVTDKSGLTKNQVDKYIDKVAYYDPATSKRCFNLAMRLHDKLKFGNRLAYLALVSGW